MVDLKSLESDQTHPYTEAPPRPVPVGSPVWIMKSCQRKNYGSLIIKEIKNLNYIRKIFLEVSAENTQAINFYLKNGFKKIGIRRAYYKDNNKRTDALRLLFEF